MNQLEQLEQMEPEDLLSYVEKNYTIGTRNSEIINYNISNEKEITITLEEKMC